MLIHVDQNVILKHTYIVIKLSLGEFLKSQFRISG